MVRASPASAMTAHATDRRSPDIRRRADPAVAARGRGADLRDAAGGRRDAADRVRAVDHRMEAGDRRGAAADRKAHGRPSSKNIRRSRSTSELNRGMTLERVQDHLLVGMDASSAGAADRRRVPAAVRVVPLARLDRAAACARLWAFSRSARCRARSAGGWCPRALPAA